MVHSLRRPCGRFLRGLPNRRRRQPANPQFPLPYRSIFRYLEKRTLGQKAFRRGAVMKELVEIIAKALVDNPEQVVVTEVEGEQTTVLELRVAPSDLGKVIGKQGRTARCIRTLLGAAGMKLKKRFVLEILEWWSPAASSRSPELSKPAAFAARSLLRF